MFLFRTDTMLLLFVSFPAASGFNDIVYRMGINDPVSVLILLIISFYYWENNVQFNL